MKTAVAPPETQGRKPPLEIGKTSISVDGKEIVFGNGQTDLPGMPDVSRLRKLADAFVAQADMIETEESRLRKIRQEIMMELKGEGRADFAFRKGPVTYTFQIAVADEKLKVQKKQ